MSFEVHIGRRGFSLLEAILACVVVGLAMLPILTTLSSANRGTVDVENEALAVGLANEALEWVRAVGFSGWCRALADGGKSVRLASELKVDATAGKISTSEPTVVAFKADDSEVEYPSTSISYGRWIVLTFDKDPGSGEIRSIRAEATVRWHLNVRGEPERHVTMELVLQGGWQ